MVGPIVDQKEAFEGEEKEDCSIIMANFGPPHSQAEDSPFSDAIVHKNCALSAGIRPIIEQSSGSSVTGEFYSTNESTRERGNDEQSSQGASRDNYELDDTQASKSGKIQLELVSREIIEASKKGDLHTITELHAKGYSLVAIDDKGWSALHHASCGGHENVVQYLAATEPDLMDMRENVEGFTPLHIAAKYRQQKVCYILAAAGCCVSKVDYFGMTPKHLARMEGDDELAAYLERELMGNILITISEKDVYLYFFYLRDVSFCSSLFALD